MARTHVEMAAINTFGFSLSTRLFLLLEDVYPEGFFRSEELKISIHSSDIFHNLKQDGILKKVHRKQFHAINTQILWTLRSKTLLE